MARTPASLPGGLRLSDYLSVGVIIWKYPPRAVREALRRTGRGSVRRRSLPAEVMVYYVIAMGLFRSVSTREVLRCLMEGLRWISPELMTRDSDKSSISRARTRLGAEPFAALREACVRPLAEASTPGAWYRGLRLVGFNGSTLAVPDEEENRIRFELPGTLRGRAGSPKLRLTILAEIGTRAPLAWCGGPLGESEMKQAERLVPHLSSGMLVLADRYGLDFPTWHQSVTTGAELLWRVRSNLCFPVRENLPDGSWISVLKGSGGDRRTTRGAYPVRILIYRLPGNDERITLATTLLDPAAAPAAELAALFHERWEIETAQDDVNTHMLGAGAVLRSKTPGLVLQELDGLMLAHHAVRSLIHEAAGAVTEDPDRLSFLHTVDVVRRRIVHPGAPSAGNG